MVEEVASIIATSQGQCSRREYTAALFLYEVATKYLILCGPDCPSSTPAMGADILPSVKIALCFLPACLSAIFGHLQLFPSKVRKVVLFISATKYFIYLHLFEHRSPSTTRAA